MDINTICNNGIYSYRKPNTRYAIPIEVITIDTTRNLVLVFNLNTRKTMKVNADNLSPIQPSKHSTSKK